MAPSRSLIAALLVACGNDHAPRALDAPPLDGLPCDVRDVIASACAQCHASPTTSGAPEPLLSRADFFAQSSVAGQNEGQRSHSRLHDAATPMPPLSEPPLSADAFALLDGWFVAGMPTGTCDALAAGYHIPTCASGNLWSGGANDDTMDPGKACVSCHQMSPPAIPHYFMGTGFPAYHEGNDCEDATPAGARVEILDPIGNITAELFPDGVGNFYSASMDPGVPVPYRARLIVGERVRTMVNPVTSGDCNDCHTEQGTNGAPGRLVWP